VQCHSPVTDDGGKMFPLEVFQ